MVREDVAEVVRIIRLHDSDDAEHAGRYLAEEATFTDDPDHGHIVAEDRAEERVVGVSGWGADGGEGEGIFWVGWTYVNPWSQGKGVGLRLLEAVIGRVRERRGRKLYVETSSLAKYAKAVRVYERLGFVQEGRLRDFYAPGEDKLVLGMALTDKPEGLD